MDPVTVFGIISGGVQVAGAILSTVDGLNKLLGKFKDADLTIESMIRELKCIRTALTSLREWAEERKSPPPAQISREIPHFGDPQELPGNLEQGPPSSRSATPEGMRRYAPEATMPPGTGVRDLRLPDQPDLPPHLTALLRESQHRSSLPQLEQQAAEKPKQHQNTPHNIPGTSATIIPRPIPVRWPSPPTQASPDGYRAGLSIPTVPSPVSVLEQQDDAAYIPRTIPSTQNLILPRSQSGSVSSPKKASHDESPDYGSDSESFSSVYTASEGQAEPDTDVNVRSGIHELREGVHELAIHTL